MHGKFFKIGVIFSVFSLVPILLIAGVKKKLSDVKSPYQVGPLPGEVNPPAPPRDIRVDSVFSWPDIERYAKLALNTAQRAKQFLSVGNVWVVAGPKGSELKAGILYGGFVVFVLHFDPSTGEVLPLGYHPVFNGNPTVVFDKVNKELPVIIKNLKVVNAVDYRDAEQVWVIPLSYNNIIVGELKIYKDGLQVVPDYVADREMRIYAK